MKICNIFLITLLVGWSDFIGADIVRGYPLIPHAERNPEQFFAYLGTHPKKQKVWLREINDHPSGLYNFADYQSAKEYFLNNTNVQFVLVRGWVDDQSTPNIHRYTKDDVFLDVWKRETLEKKRWHPNEWMAVDRGVMIFLASCGNIVEDEPKDYYISVKLNKTLVCKGGTVQYFNSRNRNIGLNIGNNVSDNWGSTQRIHGGASFSVGSEYGSITQQNKCIIDLNK